MVRRQDRAGSLQRGLHRQVVARILVVAQSADEIHSAVVDRVPGGDREAAGAGQFHKEPGEPLLVELPAGQPSGQR